MITCTSITLWCSTQSPFIFQDHCGNVAVPVEQPINVHFTDEENVSQWHEEDDLQTETVKEKLETGTDEGCSVADDEGTCRSLRQTSSNRESVEKETLLILLTPILLSFRPRFRFRFLIYTGNAPCAFDSDSASDSITSVNQPLQRPCL